MSDFPKTFYWKDRPVSELDRAELLEAIAFLADFYEKNTTDKAIRAKSIGMASMLIRGERYYS